MLFSIHAQLAAWTSTPELKLDESEAKDMADAMARVARHYPVLNNISEKAIDHANFVTVFGGIYASRVIAMRFRQAADAAQPSQEVYPPNVRPIHTTPGA